MYNKMYMYKFIKKTLVFPLFQLKMTPLHWSAEKGHLDVVEVLLKSGADMTCENKFEKTPLEIAITNGRPDIVQAIQMAQVSMVSVFLLIYFLFYNPCLSYPLPPSNENRGEGVNWSQEMVGGLFGEMLCLKLLIQF